MKGGGDFWHTPDGSLPDGRIYDHPPARPSGAEHRCLRCGRLVIAHAGWLRRWAWRQGLL